jgi:hypothetical protein
MALPIQRHLVLGVSCRSSGHLHKKFEIDALMSNRWNSQSRKRHQDLPPRLLLSLLLHRVDRSRSSNFELQLIFLSGLTDIATELLASEETYIRQLSLATTVYKKAILDLGVVPEEELAILLPPALGIITSLELHPPILALHVSSLLPLFSCSLIPYLLVHPSTLAAHIKTPFAISTMRSCVQWWRTVTWLP